MDYILRVYKDKNSEEPITELNSDNPFMSFSEGDVITTTTPPDKDVIQSKIIRIEHWISGELGNAETHEIGIWTE